MTLLTDAQVQIILADYANSDAIGKLNVLGTGFNLIYQVPGGAWPPMYVAVVVRVPAKYAGEDYALAVQLYDATLGKVVQVPGEGGQLQPMLVQQAVTVPPLNIPPGFQQPHDAQVQHVMMMGFPTGLPLKPGSTYEWRVELDGQSMKHWWLRFHTLAPVAGPVFGGPGGPSTIPGVTPEDPEGDSA